MTEHAATDQPVVDLSGLPRHEMGARTPLWWGTGLLVAIESTQPDVVIMDIRLGRRDSGLRVARLVRANIDVPIVFCTAYADNPSVLAEIRSIDNTHVIGKPVDESQFEWLLRSIDERRRKISTAAALVSPATSLLPVSNDL